MKKGTKFLLIVTSLIVLFGITDFILSTFDKRPIFVIRTAVYRDGGSKDYLGLGYKVIKCNTLSGDKTVHFGFYNIDVDEVCNRGSGESNSTGTAEYLFNLKTEYIGDNSAVGKLLEALDLRIYGHYTFELKTSEKPYALIINYNQIEGWGSILNYPETVIEKSAIFLALIDNADEIHWVLPDNIVHKITISDLLDEYGNIKEYGKSAEDLKNLLIKLGYYEINDPITMNIKDLTNSGLTLTIKNHTNSNYLYGDPYDLQRKENDKWIEVQEIADNCAFNMIGYTLKAKQEIEKKVNWEYCYGKLPAGQYRVIKDFDHIISELSELSSKFGKKHIISAEFII